MTCRFPRRRRRLAERAAARRLWPRFPSASPRRDVSKGQANTKACQACHNFEKGAGAKVGPDLYGVVDRPKGSVAGFGYSDGMKAKGGDWTFDDLDHFLTNPKAFVSGTKMAFAGEADPQKRADIIDYLHTLSEARFRSAAPPRRQGSRPPRPQGGRSRRPLRAASPAEEGEAAPANSRHQARALLFDASAGLSPGVFAFTRFIK